MKTIMPAVTRATDDDWTYDSGTSCTDPACTLCHGAAGTGHRSAR